MEQVDATLFDGGTVVVSDHSFLLDALDALGGSLDAPGWHAHAALPLGTIVQPGTEMRLETADGRSGPVVLFCPPTVEGSQSLHEFVGIGPLARPGA